MRIDPTMLPREGCIRAADGTVSDAGFHDLDDEPVMTREEILQSRQRLLERGWSREDVEAMFPLPV